MTKAKLPEMTLEESRSRLELVKMEWEAEVYRLDALKRRDELEALAASQQRAHIYSFDDPVTTSSVGRAIHTLSVWYRHDPETPIEVVFSSPGGYVFDGFGFYDFMTDLVNQGCDLTTRAVGYAASMAGILLQAGKTRAISPHSYLMIHEVGGEAWGKMSEVRDEVELMERLEKSCFEILAKRSKFDVEQLRDRCKRKDWWLNAREAKRHGFVDVIR